MSTYCIDVCGDTEESNLRRHNIPFEQLRDTLRDMLDQYHRITGEPVNGNDVDDEARDLLADCLIDAANKGIQPTHDNPMSAGDGLVEIWEEPDIMTPQEIYLVVVPAGRDGECEVPVYAFPTEQMAEQCARMLQRNEERKRMRNPYGYRGYSYSVSHYAPLMFDHVPDMEELKQEGK